MMDVKKSLFFDTNILIYASIKEAPEHQKVRSFIEKHLILGTPLYISRQILREYLAVLSRPQANFTSISKHDILLWLNTWQSRCIVLDDTEMVMKTLWELFENTALGGKQVHDANIVATMFSHKLDTLVTVNSSDFLRFSPRLKLIDPTKNEN